MRSLILRNRVAGVLVSASFCAFGTWIIVSGALGQARDPSRSAVSRAQGVAAWEQVDTFVKIDDAWFFAERLLYVDWIDERPLP
jgi:hypothetical protein